MDNSSVSCVAHYRQSDLETGRNSGIKAKSFLCPFNMKTLLLFCALLLSVSGSPLGNPYGTSQNVHPHSHVGYGSSLPGHQPAPAGGHTPSNLHPVGYPSAAHAPTIPQGHPGNPAYAHATSAGHPGVPAHPQAVAPGYTGSNYSPGLTTPGHSLSLVTPHASVHSQGVLASQLPSAYAPSHTSTLLDAIAAHLIATHPLMQMKPTANPHAGSLGHPPHTPGHLTYPHAIPAGAYGSGHAPAQPNLVPSAQVSAAHAATHPHVGAGGYLTTAHPHIEYPHTATAGHPAAPHIPTQITAPGANVPHPGHYGTQADHDVSRIIEAHMHAIQQHIDSHEKTHYGKAGISDHFRATKQSAHALASAYHTAMAAHRPAAPYLAAPHGTTHIPTVPPVPANPFAHSYPVSPAGPPQVPQPQKLHHVTIPSLPDAYESYEYDVSEPGAM